MDKTPPKTLEQQVQELVAIAMRNRVDAWDLGFEHQLSPGDREGAVKQYIARFGYEQSKTMLEALKK